ncbi:MAG: LptF/LptG family permease [Bacteroidales bacterium]|nr:LptF/LptG family permease [Bacteroidales bacterium]MBN2763020.1 LptF/LptG family permease [Bacteroidales bacterium]
MLIIDRYIIRKFLSTFFFSIALIMAIAVVFDFSEKIDDFLESKAPLNKVIFEYYLNFIPYFASLFSHLFTFIAVIYFTSRMAYNTEFIAILSNGVSFNRILYPYFIAASIITIFSFTLNNFIIPHASAKKLAFEEQYYHRSPRVFNERNIHKQIRPGIYIYLENFNTYNNSGRKFSMEKFENGELVSKLLSREIRWDSTTRKWRIRDYLIRDYQGEKQIITSGRSIDTTLNITPEEFRRRENAVEAMNLPELNRFIKTQRMQGAPNLDELLIEKHKRFSFPFSTFILTLIGVSVSSRKVKGGIGMQIGIGLLISFSYILFLQFSAQFAISGAFSPFIAAWIPNVLFAIIAIFLYRMSPK